MPLTVSTRAQKAQQMSALEAQVQDLQAAQVGFVDAEYSRALPVEVVDSGLVARDRIREGRHRFDFA